MSVIVDFEKAINQKDVEKYLELSGVDDINILYYEWLENDIMEFWGGEIPIDVITEKYDCNFGDDEEYEKMIYNNDIEDFVKYDKLIDFENKSMNDFLKFYSDIFDIEFINIFDIMRAIRDRAIDTYYSLLGEIIYNHWAKWRLPMKKEHKCTPEQRKEIIEKKYISRLMKIMYL